MLKYFLFSLISTALLQCTSSKNTTQLDSYLEIEFQDGFSDETISMAVNGCRIFDDGIVTSSKNLGTTEKNVSLYKLKDKFQVKFENTNIMCSQNNQIEPTITIFVNSRQNVFQFDRQMGKYIGLNLGNDNKIDVLQLNRPFRHE